MGHHDAAILVVDDNENNRELLVRRLAKEGYANVVLAEDGRAALDRLIEKPFDLVLLDIMMPNLNGYEVLEEMKATRDCATSRCWLFLLFRKPKPSCSASNLAPTTTSPSLRHGDPACPCRCMP